LNGSAALIDSALGYRTGFWNPTCTGRHRTAIAVHAARHRRDQQRQPLLHWYPGTVFNPATGLGVPNLGQVKSLFDK